MDQRCEIFFSGGEGGFQETWWRQSEDDLLAARTATVRLAEFRQAMLGPLAKCIEVRVSDENELNDSYVNFPPAITTIWAADLTSPNFVALLVRLQGTSLYKKNLFMRGLPNGVKYPFTTNATSAKFRTPFDDWAAEVVGNSRWCVKSISREAADRRRKILKFDPTFANLPQTRILVPGHNFGPGDAIRVSLRQSQYGNDALHYRGVYRVTDVVAGIWVTFNRSQPAAIHVDYDDGGYASPQRTRYQPIDSVLPQRIVRHKSGQPIGAAKGHSKKTHVTL